MALLAPAFESWNSISSHPTQAKPSILLLQSIINNLNHLLHSAVRANEISICVTELAPFFAQRSIVFTSTHIALAFADKWQPTTLTLLRSSHVQIIFAVEGKKKSRPISRIFPTKKLMASGFLSLVFLATSLALAAQSALQGNLRWHWFRTSL